MTVLSDSVGGPPPPPPTDDSSFQDHRSVNLSPLELPEGGEKGGERREKYEGRGKRNGK